MALIVMIILGGLGALAGLILTSLVLQEIFDRFCTPNPYGMVQVLTPCLLVLGLCIGAVAGLLGAFWLLSGTWGPGITKSGRHLEELLRR